MVTLACEERSSFVKNNEIIMENIMQKEERESFSAQDMVLIAVFAALITVCSFIKITLGPVPFTLQTFGVFVAAGILGTKRGTLSVIVYILLGFIGIPVFGGSGGPGVIQEPLVVISQDLFLRQ